MFRHIFKRAFVSLFHRWLDELETDTLNKI